MLSRITEVLFERFLKETLEIQKVPVDIMTITFALMTVVHLAAILEKLLMKNLEGAESVSPQKKLSQPTQG